MSIVLEKEVLDLRENLKDFEKKFNEVYPKVKYCDEIGSVLEYSSDEGVLFSVDIMDEDGRYLFNFGDVSFDVNQEAFEMISEMIRNNSGDCE